MIEEKERRLILNLNDLREHDPELTAKYFYKLIPGFPKAQLIMSLHSKMN